MWRQLPIYTILGTVNENPVKISVPSCVLVPIEYPHDAEDLLFLQMMSHM